MFYRYFIKKNGISSGLFHPLPEWKVPKEGGLYEVVPKYFESLPYHKTFTEESVSWFTEHGREKYSDGLEALERFYKHYGIEVICITTEDLENIADQDEYQIWCLKNGSE